MTRIETLALYDELKDKIELFYNKGVDYKVFTSDNGILITGKEKVLSGTYYYPVPGEIHLSIEQAKRFLETLNKAIIINGLLGNDGISFRVTEGSKIVFAMDGKEISDSDIDTIYRHLEEREEKSPLPLALNMIKVTYLYRRYIDLYEQVSKKHEFLESYNELISTTEGKKTAIGFAKRYRGTWLRVEDYIPRRDFDITGDEDIVDTIVNGERLLFDYTQVPLDRRKKYLENLENYELRINNLIERLETETRKLLEYNEKASKILDSISETNRFSIEPISDLPEYDCISIDVILDEEKQKYDKEIRERSQSTYKPETIDDKYPWLRDIDEQQRANLNQREKTAIMLYKSLMYHLFNHIISYVRDNNIELSEIANDPYIESMIREEYEEYVERNKNPKTVLKKNVSTVVDDLLLSNGIISYERFRQIALDHVVLLEPALSKITLTEPLTVYRCVHEPLGSSLYDGDLGNAFLSTSTSTNFVSNFLKQREGDIAHEAEKVIYKIELPVGSPIIAYTDDVFLKNGTEDINFHEEQQEILIDSNAYDFEYVEADFNRLKDGTIIHSITLKAIPKKLKESDTNEKNSNK